MRKSLMLLVLFVGAVFTIPCYGEVSEKVVEKSVEKVVKGSHRVLDTLSYSVGAAYAVAIKGDAAFEGFDYDIAQFNRGVVAQLTSKSEGLTSETLDKLEHFLSQRLVEYKGKRAEEPTAELKLYESDDERNQLSYAFGLYWGEKIHKLLVKGEDVIHYYWLRQAFDDVYNGKVALPIDAMVVFLKRCQAPVATEAVSEVAAVAVAEAAVEAAK